MLKSAVRASLLSTNLDICVCAQCERLFITRCAQYAVNVRLSRRSTAAAATGRFAAEVARVGPIV